REEIDARQAQRSYDRLGKQTWAASPSAEAS
ncbi:MAG: hypothetical protein QOJ15_3981, partial [Bradyrhizobium sp.]|nr:hypothetical protein [Bradyrhizobium sp.]